MQEACKVPWFCSQHHNFVPSSLEVAAGFLVLLLLLLFWVERNRLTFLHLVVHNCPQLCMCTVISESFGVSLYFSAQWDICPGASTVTKSPRSQVPACFNPHLNTPVTWCPHYTKNPQRGKKNPIKKDINVLLGFPCGTLVKELSCKCRRHKTQGFDPWVWKIPWRRKCNPFQYSC